MATKTVNVLVKLEPEVHLELRKTLLEQGESMQKFYVRMTKEYLKEMERKKNDE